MIANKITLENMLYIRFEISRICDGGSQLINLSDQFYRFSRLKQRLRPYHNLQIVNQFIVAHCRLERDTLLSSFLRPGAFAHAELCRAPIAKP